MAALLVETPTSPDAQWFASWFDTTEYRRLYAHRNEAEAARLVDALVPRLRLPQGARVLDLGCGAGRHSRRLAAWGLDVTGLDLAATSIREARRSERPGLRFRRHDMRVPFGTGEFDSVSTVRLRYFDDAADHLAVVRNISQALKPGGTLISTT
jgi:2-polyprenyl-3-methyl-5-hydroxy-6-metoxy-1,4-benzoquinol methylase